MTNKWVYQLYRTMGKASILIITFSSKKKALDFIETVKQYREPTDLIIKRELVH